MTDEPIDPSTIFGPTAPAKVSTQLDHAADEIASMFGPDPDEAPGEDMKRRLPAPPLRAGPEGAEGPAQGQQDRRGFPTPELRERDSANARGMRTLLVKIERLERDLAEAVQRIVAVDNHLATTYRAVRVLAKKFAESSSSSAPNDGTGASGDEVIRAITDRLSTLEDRVSASLTRAEGSREALSRLDRSITGLREELAGRSGKPTSEGRSEQAGT